MSYYFFYFPIIFTSTCMVLVVTFYLICNFLSGLKGTVGRKNTYKNVLGLVQVYCSVSKGEQ